MNTRQNLDHVKESKTGELIMKNAVSWDYFLSTQNTELKPFILHIYLYGVVVGRKSTFGQDPAFPMAFPFPSLF